MGVRCGPAHELQELRGTCPADSLERKCSQKMWFQAEEVLPKATSLQQRFHIAYDLFF